MSCSKGDLSGKEQELGIRLMGELKTLGQCIELISHLYDQCTDKRHGYFTRYCHDLFPMGIWFRGEEARSESILTPHVFRKVQGQSYDESALYSHAVNRFPIEYHGQQRDKYYDVFPSLIYMQHYGVPTRLLDWSESMPSALFFAVEKTDSEHDSLLHVLNARKLNAKTSFALKPEQNLHTREDFGTMLRCLFCEADTIEKWCEEAAKFSNRVGFKWQHPNLPEQIKNCTDTRKYEGKEIPLAAIEFLRQPVAVVPGLVHARLKSQQGTFTLHGGKITGVSSTDPKTLLPPEKSLTEIDKETETEGQFLRSYLIRKDSKRRIKRELLAMGIRAGVLYPEVDRQAEHLEEMFRR